MFASPFFSPFFGQQVTVNHVTADSGAGGETLLNLQLNDGLDSENTLAHLIDRMFVDEATVSCLIDGAYAPEALSSVSSDEPVNLESLLLCSLDTAAPLEELGITIVTSGSRINLEAVSLMLRETSLMEESLISATINVPPINEMLLVAQSDNLVVAEAVALASFLAGCFLESGAQVVVASVALLENILSAASDTVSVDEILFSTEAEQGVLVESNVKLTMTSLANIESVLASAVSSTRGNAEAVSDQTTTSGLFDELLIAVRCESVEEAEKVAVLAAALGARVEIVSETSIDSLLQTESHILVTAVVSSSPVAMEFFSRFRGTIVAGDAPFASLRAMDAAVILSAADAAASMTTTDASRSEASSADSSANIDAGDE